jgi:hypothetical protein
MDCINSAADAVAALLAAAALLPHPELPMMQGESALPRIKCRRAMVGGRGHGRQGPWFRC